MSKFIVSARKYRPTRFEDMIGQNHIAKTLQNSIVLEKLAHAFLFCGPRGVGKTTCARILAKVINCLNPINKVDPCNECSCCKAFNDNASFNIFELDGASNNGVDDIRAILDQARYHPQHGAYKVFIIDEVHMLSAAAFNALLKTLEEPPSHVKFILATTEKHKILPTVLSRCQIFDFKRIQPQDIVLQLQKICTEEQRKADEEALFQIAVKADGGMRDALSLFDKISGNSGEVITYKDVVSNLNILDYDYYFKIVDAFLRSDLPDVLNALDEIIKNGFEIESFLDGLSQHFRDLLLSKNPNTMQILESSDTLKQRYFNQANLLQEGFVLSALNIINMCDLTISRSNNKRVHTELALSKITYAKQAYEADFLAPSGQIKKKMMA